MGIETAIAALKADPDLADGWVEWRTIPPQPARFASWPRALDERLLRALAQDGIEQPFTHQAEAIALALEGRDQVVVTPTASGKTLCYNVPVVQSVVDDPATRALYLFPTKALAQDQLHELHSLVTTAGIDLKTFTYDGDTSPVARRAVRTAGHVVITNPDMLHTGVLPNHTKWVRLFENLRYVVIDELHTYRGVFGSHVANVLRRLLRLCAFYGSDPTFICSSATIANPAELASMLTGRDVVLVDDNGAPRGERVLGLYNPPLLNAQLGIRRGVVHSARAITERLSKEGAQSIVFARSRHEVELLTQYLRDAGPATPQAKEAVRGYRSGYLPKERRDIEAGLRSGEVRTVVSTNALEMGIDIGGMQAAVLAGYPGTLASLWQQLGRAGRSNEVSLGVVVASSDPLGQYVVSNTDFLFGQPVESALINPDNPIVAGEHLKCAVFELPLDGAEAHVVGAHTPALIDVLAEDGTLFRQGERVYWSSQAYPAEEISLRLGAEQNVVIIDQGPPARVIGQVDRPSAMTLVHDEAIYVHDGVQYHVDRLDWEELKAYVRHVDVDYYTDAQLAVDLKVLEEWDGEHGTARRGHGEVAVTYLASIFKKIKLYSHENVGWGQILLPQDDLHTGAFWITLPPDLEPVASRAEIEGALTGLGELLGGVAPLLLMCDPRDLHVATQVRAPHTGVPTVYLWESVPGGVGFGQHLFNETGRLLAVARNVLMTCACTDGCPGCVGPPSAPGLAVKGLVGLALERLCAVYPPGEAGLRAADLAAAGG
ncbi:MAG: DEAD/DEAH box helicase [Dehalococcoidia bacterium]|nr:DEAD/DEAH box helicase [Dehalococcoidia bacterium]